MPLQLAPLTDMKVRNRLTHWMLREVMHLAAPATDMRPA